MPKKSSKGKQKNKSSIERMKMEIANDFGVNLGADSTSRENGAVGGEMTRRLVKMAQEDSDSSCSSSSKSKSTNRSKTNK